MVLFISEKLYGLEFLTFNVQILCHIIDDAAAYGAFYKFSSFPFENYLCKIKKLVKSPNKPLPHT